MIDTESLRDVLKTIYGVEDRYLIELCSDDFVPTIDPNDKVGTYIGYRILAKEGYSRARQESSVFVLPLKVHFRLSFVGVEAEKLADEVFLFDVRRDVVDAFEKYQAQVNYNDRTQYTRPVKNHAFGNATGIGGNLAWIIDMSCQTDYQKAVDYPYWFPQTEDSTESGSDKGSGIKLEFGAAYSGNDGSPWFPGK